jgi:transcription antitermination factor NusG
MNPEHAHGEEHAPGDWAKVIGGTFVGMEGRAIDIAEVRGPHAQGEGENPDTTCPSGWVWLALPIFGREAPILLTYDQIEHVR